MGNALARDGQNYRWDSLFQALTRPDDLREYLERTGSSHGPLRTQIELLTGTLQVDLSLLKVAEVAESFDTATFCLGQLVSHEPRMVSELPFALIFVDGLSSAVLQHPYTVLCDPEDDTIFVTSFTLNQVVRLRMTGRTTAQYKVFVRGAQLDGPVGKAIEP